MNHFEEQVKRAKLQPRKELSPNFTSRILAKLAERPAATWHARLKENLTMKLPFKPSLALATLAAIVSLSATAYAIGSFWPTITTKVTDQKPLPSGERIVTIDTTNCSYFSGGITSGETTKEYYRISKDTRYTAEQIRQHVQRRCEGMLRETVVLNMSAEFNQTNLYWTPLATITSITDTEVVVQTDTGTETYATAGAKAYDGMNPSSLDKLHKGDIVMVVMGSQGAAQKVMGSDAKLLALVKVPHLEPAPAHSDAENAQYEREIVQVNPCDSDPSGFCPTSSSEGIKE